MFERYTEDAREMVAAAGRKASEHGHLMIEPLHLVAALADGRATVAGRVLCELAVDGDVLGQRLADLAPERADARTFSHAFRHALELALREALSLGHNYVGSEHLLLGVVACGDAAVDKLLADLGLEADRFSEAVVRRLAAVHPAGAPDR